VKYKTLNLDSQSNTSETYIYDSGQSKQHQRNIQILIQIVKETPVKRIFMIPDSQNSTRETYKY
jgi:hypothetical protein